MVGEHVRSHKLQLLLEEYSSEIGGLYVVYPSRTHLAITVRTFVDFISAKAASGVPWERLV